MLLPTSSMIRTPTYSPKPVANALQNHAAQHVQLMDLGNRFKIAFASSDFTNAVAYAEQALKISPGNMSILPDYALSLMRTRQFDKAYAIYKSIHNAPASQRKQASPTWIDGLAEVCGWLGKHEEMREYGLRSLQASDKLRAAKPSVTIPDESPPVFNSANPSENIIAYSLFGDNPRYCEPAVMNAEVARDIFKGWTCRVYLDATVPDHVTRRLKEAGADVILMSADNKIHPLMWRFLVTEDPQVKRFLIRDADALLSEREYAAVAEWVKSPYYFHIIRDYFSHTELILAGLWGGCTGVLSNMVESMQLYAAANAQSGRFIDQHYLREHVWPTLRKSVLSHDDLFGFHHAVPFPPHEPNRWSTDKFHVGSNTSYQALGGTSTLDDNAIQRLVFTSRTGIPQFDYSVVVRNHEWKLDMPFFRIDEITRGDLIISKVD
jgi:hypothetical protein